MVKFLQKIAIVLFSVTVLLVAYSLITYYLIDRYDETGHNASIIDKLERLESINEPKIILVGNSNLSFGIDSKMIEDEFEMPVVNLGLNGGLGNVFHELMAKYNINSGDIVVIAHTEYGTDYFDTSLICETVVGKEYLYPTVPKELYWQVAKTLPSYSIDAWGDFIFQRYIISDPATFAYARGAFNEYGDNIFPREKPTVDYSENTSAPPSITKETTDRLNEFNEECLQVGATLVIAAYPIVNGEGAKPIAEFQSFQDELAEHLDSPVISDFTEYILDYSYFYDTVYHLNDQGVEIRTQLLIEDLKKIV